jgi:DNA-3-methyladenine glycosylase II
MKRLIPQFGDACLQSRGDAFTTLARSIVGQQISVKAAQTVWDRFAALPRKLTPANVLKLKVDDMRAAGLSARKVEYLVDLALHFDSGAACQGLGGHGRRGHHCRAGGHPRHRPLDGRDVPDLPPDAPNVLPLDDVGLINGISQNYFSGEPVSRSDAREVAEAWAPYRSVATWYIWRSLDPLPVAY